MFVIKECVKLTVHADWQKKIQVKSRSVALRRFFDLTFNRMQMHIRSILFIGNTSSVYIYINTLNEEANCFFPVKSSDFRFMRVQNYATPSSV